MTNMQANYLVSIVMCGNFRDAAEALFVTPSTISQSMASLEAEYGAKLLLRTRGGIVLTPLGEQLYLIARDIVKRFQDAEALKADTTEPEESSASSIAIFGTGLRRCLRPILFKQLASSTEVGVNVYDADLSAVPGLLREKKISFAVVSAPSSFYRSFSEEFSCQILTRTNMMLHVSQDHPLIRKTSHKFNPLSNLGTYTMADMSEYSFVFSSEEMLSIMEDQVPTFPWKKQTILISSDMGLLSDLIRNKNAIGVSMDDHLFPEEDGTAFIPMEMSYHFLNLHSFVVSEDIKALGTQEKFIISEIRRSIFRQAY